MSRDQLSPREAVREMDGATYDLALAWPTVELSHPDMYALDVAAYILGEGESSRLVQRLKYDKQAVLSVAPISETPHYVAGMFVARPSAGPRRGGRPPRKSSARSIACARSWSARPSWPRPRSRRRPS